MAAGKPRNILVLGAGYAGLMAAHRTVDVDGRFIGYDSLVIALGSRTDMMRVPGALPEHATQPEVERG